MFCTASCRILNQGSKYLSPRLRQVKYVAQLPQRQLDDIDRKADSSIAKENTNKNDIHIFKKTKKVARPVDISQITSSGKHHDYGDTYEGVSMVSSSMDLKQINYVGSSSSKEILRQYLNLSKFRLTALVSATTLFGVVVAPVPLSLFNITVIPIGTVLLSSGANCMNQLLEINYDTQMKRTQGRVLVQRLNTPLNVLCFSIASAAAGTALLYNIANPLTAGLGLLNYAIYSFAYTPSKRITQLNTWIGALVGAIPPMMGYTAMVGTIDSSCLLIGGILFSWQFPHFNSLSWKIRDQYARAGYHMMSVVAPDRCALTALTHSVYLTGMCLLAPGVGLTAPSFIMDSLLVNAPLVALSVQFYTRRSSKSANYLFLYSLIHLPLIMFFMCLSKADFKTTQQRSILAAIDDFVPQFTPLVT